MPEAAAVTVEAVPALVDATAIVQVPDAQFTITGIEQKLADCEPIAPAAAFAPLVAAQSKIAPAAGVVPAPVVVNAATALQAVAVPATV